MTYRRFVHLLLATVLALTVSTPALAAAPTNDDIATATVITALPFTETIDTSESTTAPDEPWSCYSTPTVWYTFTPTVSGLIDVNTWGSNYDTVLQVNVGEPGSLNLVACNDNDGNQWASRVIFEATAGMTYYFMVGGQDNPVGNLTFSVQVMPPPLEMDFTLDPSGSFNAKTGAATLRGTVTCNRSADQPAGVSLYGTLEQSIGRVTFRGYSSTYYTSCSDTPTAWSLTVTAGNGKFAGGHAQAYVYVEAYDGYYFVYDQATGTVTLKR